MEIGLYLGGRTKLGCAHRGFGFATVGALTMGLPPWVWVLLIVGLNLLTVGLFVCVCVW